MAHKTKFEEAKKALNIEDDDVFRVRSKPLKRGVIRVDWFKVNSAYYLLDDSENSEGFFRVVGKRAKELKLREIEAAA